VIEVPLIIEDTALFTLSHPREAWVGALETVKSSGGILTLLWHPAVFNEHEFPGWGGTYREILGRCREEGAWITSAREVASWWKGRDVTRPRGSYRKNRLEVGAIPGERPVPLLVHVPQGLIMETLSHGTLLSTGPEIYRIRMEPDPELRPLVMTFSEVDHED
jgi:hypothetical protein